MPPRCARPWAAKSRCCCRQVSQTLSLPPQCRFHAPPTSSPQVLVPSPLKKTVPSVYTLRVPEHLHCSCGGPLEWASSTGADMAAKSNQEAQAGGLHATLNEMKRMIEEEREAAELMTRQLANHRDVKHTFGTRPSLAESELVEAKKQIAEQKATTEKWIQQITAERDAGRSRLREAEASVLQLQQELQETRAQHLKERQGAESLVQQLYAEKDQAREELATMQPPASEAKSDSFIQAMKEMEERIAVLQNQMAEQQSAFDAKETALIAEREWIKAEASQAAGLAAQAYEDLHA